MQYREMGSTGEKVSILGYGCMRFPRRNGRIDEQRATRQILSAIDQGVNYFDTAYIYPGSEPMLGKALSNGARDKVLIATKMPPMSIHSQGDMEKVLEAQLKNLQTDRIDFYLMHMLSTPSAWERLKALGIEGFLEKAKQAGKIRHLGFSFHGNREDFKAIADAYPWEFCQIQYNYLDENYQAGKEGLQYASAKGLGVVIMEPLRGGLLVRKMPPQVQAVWNQAEEKKTPAEWALRWIWDHPEVTSLLSGMNEEAHIEENIRIATSALPNSLSEKDLALVEKAKSTFLEGMKVGCTGCGYCLPCPVGVNIPTCFGLYNDKHLFKSITTPFMYLGVTAGVDGGKPAYASLCKDCGKCEKHCPQSLPIRQHLKAVSRELEPFYFKPVEGVLRGYFKIRGQFKKARNSKRIPNA